MAQITSDGYQDLRDRIQANWTYIELRDDAAGGTGGDPIVRIAETDPRVSWIHSGGAQALQLRVVLTGSDADVPVPVTIRSSAIYKVSSAGSAMSAETLVEGDATINADPDSVTITHTIEVPDIP
jgi:hypothetical protein